MNMNIQCNRNDLDLVRLILCVSRALNFLRISLESVANLPSIIFLSLPLVRFTIFPRGRCLHSLPNVCLLWRYYVLLCMPNWRIIQHLCNISDNIKKPDTIISRCPNRFGTNCERESIEIAILAFKFSGARFHSHTK